ncbi:tetratricopeptide repeat protein, partial [Pyxidicoccus sp. 3LG]
MDVPSILRRSLAVALALSLTACPRTTRTPPGGDTPGEDVPTGDPFPKRPSVEAKKDPAADAALAQAKQTAEAAPDKKKAAEAFMSVRKAYPATTAGQEALYQAGVLFFESKDYVNARKTFNELLFENPLYPQADDAKHKLAVSAMEVGAYRDAYQTLSSLAERAEGDEKKQLQAEAARAAEGAGLYGQALTLAVEQAGQAQGAEEQ